MIFEKSYDLDMKIWEDIITIVFSSDIRKSVSDQLIEKGVKSKAYIPDKTANACVVDINEDHYSGGWMLFHIETVDSGIIVHECLHMTINILKRRQIKFHDKTEEVFAYTLQYLFNRVSELHQLALAEHEKQKVQ